MCTEIFVTSLWSLKLDNIYISEPFPKLCMYLSGMSARPFKWHLTHWQVVVWCYPVFCLKGQNWEKTSFFVSLVSMFLTQTDLLTDYPPLSAGCVDSVETLSLYPKCGTLESHTDLFGNPLLKVRCLKISQVFLVWLNCLFKIWFLIDMLL